MIPDCDRQTVGQTESIIAKTALCIASYADALSKITEAILEKPDCSARECMRFQAGGKMRTANLRTCGPAKG